MICARCGKPILKSEWYTVQYREDPDAWKISARATQQRYVHAASSQCSYMGRKPLETGDTL